MACKLKDTQLLSKNFINKFSHEFTTPIASINGFSELLLNTNNKFKQIEYLEIIRSESERLAFLSKNILLLNSLEKNLFPNQNSYYDLDDQLKQLIIN